MLLFVFFLKYKSFSELYNRKWNDSTVKMNETCDMLSFIISFSLLIIIKNNLTIYVFWLKLKFLYND